MKTLFIPADRKINLDVAKIQTLLKKSPLPKDIAIAYSIQYKKLAIEIKKTLSEKYNITKFMQILGCSRPSLPKKTKAILLITDGKFHGISLAIGTGIPVCLFNNNLSKIPEEEIEKFRQRQKISYIKFLNSERIGILISVKPGQENLVKALVLKKKLKDKSCYLFIGNNLDQAEFENFPEIQSWINTACSRLDFENNTIINTDKIN